MIEIKNVIFTKSEVNFIKCILCFINYILPLRLKFASESYVAFYDNEEESLITLEKDSNSYTRFKITKLFLEENSANIARELANYVITKYRAQGANSFYIAADEKQFDLLNIFKNELNFRECGCRIPSMKGPVGLKSFLEEKRICRSSLTLHKTLPAHRQRLHSACNIN